MAEAYDDLSQEIFLDYKNKYIGTQVIFKGETQSTNDDAKSMGAKGSPSGYAVVASRQTNGRGRLGRKWEGAGDTDIYMSILLRPALDGIDAQIFTLLSGLCVADTIKSITAIDTVIKWPNDVLTNGKKLCGILAESSISDGFVEFVIIGIGINVNRKFFSHDIQDKATSLSVEANRNFDRGAIVKALLSDLDKRYALLINGGCGTFINDYKRKCITLGKTVVLAENGKSVEAKAVDITDKGYLVTENIHSERRCIMSGEVSVRGLYGYV